MPGPHQKLGARDGRERFLADLLDVLWERYRSRVEYARRWEELAGNAFRNDHIAFRTVAWQDPSSGIHSVSRLFEALGYCPAGAYSFPDKKLSAVHFQHGNTAFPKLFVSELKAWELSRPAREALAVSLKQRRAPPPEAFLDSLAAPETSRDYGELLRGVTGYFTRPWPAPEKALVELVAAESQYGAWALLHGYEVNHFTAAVDDIEKAVAQLKAAKIPMKAEIEGAPGTKLRQSATEAVTLETEVRDGTLAWPYAYFELAERHDFEGFLGGQAAQLFEMTKRKNSSEN